MKKQDFVNSIIDKYADRISYEKLPDEFDVWSDQIFICHAHGEFVKKPVRLRKSGCNKCAPNRKKNFSEYVEAFNKKYDNFYDYSLNSDEYYPLYSNIKIICPKHGTFLTKVGSHIYHNGCKGCVNEIKSAERPSRVKDFSWYLEKLNLKHNNKYDYSLNTKEKYRTTDLIKIICNKHGIFETTINRHYNAGCPDCGREIVNNGLTYSFEEFVNKANIIHHNKYDYSLTDLSKYINTNSYVVVTCPLHGSFNKKAVKHLSGLNCKKCVNDLMRISEDDFIKKCNQVHNFYYDYSKTSYSNYSEKIKIICPKHGEFEKKAALHIKGRGCLSCKKNISNKEIEWLNQMNIPSEHRNLYINVSDRRFNVDGYQIIDGVAIAYEFNGDYWHGNPDVFDPHDMNKSVKISFGDLYKKTIDKKEFLEKNGIRVISIWENDFDKQNKR